MLRDVRIQNYDSVRRHRFRKVAGLRLPGPGYDGRFSKSIERWYQTWLLVCDDSQMGGPAGASAYQLAEITRKARDHEDGFIVVNREGAHHAATEAEAAEMIVGPTRIIPIVNGG